jgi:hypothetical protein
MVCGVFTTSKIPEGEQDSVVALYKANNPPPISVIAAKQADETWTVVATFPPCSPNTIHSPASTATAASGPSFLNSSTGSPARRIFDFFRVKWGDPQAAGLVANIEAESSFNPNAVGDGGLAFGLCQWHGDRQANFQRRFGHNIKASTFQEQLEFIDFELGPQGTEMRAGNLLKTAQSAEQAGEIVCIHYERPSDPDGHVSKHRGQRAQEWLRELTSTV